jgi:hypothetical protein
MSKLVHLVNKRHGSPHTVTEDEWIKMQAKGHGLKIFRVIEIVDIEPQPTPRVREIKVPAEAKAIIDKKNAPPAVEEIVPHTEQPAATAAEEVKAPAPAVVKKRGRKAQTEAHA